MSSPQFVVARKQSHIGVEMSRNIIIVTSPQMHVAPDAIFVTPNNQCQLTVRL